MWSLLLICRQQLCTWQCSGSRLSNRLLFRWILWAYWLQSRSGESASMLFHTSSNYSVMLLLHFCGG